MSNFNDDMELEFEVSLSDSSANDMNQLLIDTMRELTKSFDPAAKAAQSMGKKMEKEAKRTAANWAGTVASVQAFEQEAAKGRVQAKKVAEQVGDAAEKIKTKWGTAATAMKQASEVAKSSTLGVADAIEQVEKTSKKSKHSWGVAAALLEDSAKDAASQVKKVEDAIKSAGKEASKSKSKWAVAADGLAISSKAAAESVKKVTVASEEATKSTAKLSNEAKNAGNAVSKAGNKGAVSIEALSHMFDSTKIAIDTAIAGVAALLVGTKAIGEQVNVMQSMSPVNQKAIEEANKALGGTIDKLTLARTLQASNLDTDLFGDAAKAAAIMAKQFGFTKEHMLDAVHNGTLMETQLQALGISATFLDNKVTEYAAGMGIAAGAVDQVTVSNIKARATIEAILGKTKEWGTSTDQAGDSAARALAKIKDTSHEIGKKLLPVAVEIIETFDRWITKAEKIWQVLKETGAGIVQIASAAKAKFTELAESGVGRLLTKLAQANPLFMLMNKQASFIAGAVKSSVGFWKEAIEEKKKYLAIPLSNVGADLFAKTIAKQDAATARIETQSKRAKEARRKEALEDFQQRQEQAKDLVRNFSEKVAQVVADQGGSFGEVASGLTDVLEKTRMIVTMSWGQKGIVAASKVAAMFEGKKNVDLIHEIQLRAKSLGLQGKSLKSAILIGGWLQGNAKDTLEYMGNEKAANEQLKAGVSLLQSQAKLAQLRVERHNAFKDITQFQQSAQTVINTIIETRNKLLAKNTAAGRAEASIQTRLIKRLQVTVKQYKEIGIERGKVLDMQREILLLERESERATALRAVSKEADADRARAAALQRELQRAKGPISNDAQRELISQDALARMKAVKSEIKDISIKSAELQARVKKGLFASDADKEIAAAQLSQLHKRLVLRDLELSKIEEIRDAQLQGMSEVGRLRTMFINDAINLQQKLIESVHSGFNALVGGFGSTVMSVFETLAKGEKDIGGQIGKGFLDALAGVAAQLGGVFLLAGAGKLALFDPSGFAAIAAGTGLLAAAGALKGASSLVSDSMGSPASGGGGSSFSSSTPNHRPNSPARMPVHERTETIIVAAPWLGSPHSQARAVRKWNKSNRRAIGERAGSRF